MSNMIQLFRRYFPERHHRVFLFIYVVWIYYASWATHGVTAVIAMGWMNIFPPADLGTWPESWDEIERFFLELRTGIPPLYAFAEILTYKFSGGFGWIIKGLYRKGIIIMLLLPLFFHQRSKLNLTILFLLAVLFLEAIIRVHGINPQYYDILLPLFLMLYILLAQASWKCNLTPWLANSYAILSGLCLSWAELSRPFMIALLPILVLWNLYQYWNIQRTWRCAYFLLPILIFSGIWHTQLFYRHQQLIWSNHSGYNFLQAWTHLADHEELAKEMLPEAPPLMEGLSPNINTEVHFLNSQKRQQAAVLAITTQPLKAIQHFVYKTMIFTGPRTQIYHYDPKGPVIFLYKMVGRMLFILLGYLMIESTIKMVRNIRQISSIRIVMIGITVFLSLMPIIGEDGEESRFVVSVLPFLMICAIYAIASIVNVISTYFQPVMCKSS